MKPVLCPDDDTIVSIATGPSPGAIGLVRLSGPMAVTLLTKVFRSARGGGDDIEWPGYRARYGHIIDPANGERLDEVVVTVMRAPRSYTREDVVEVGCHGGGAVLRRILGVFLDLGARLAEPGEFTRRAFQNGRIDLIQAEAVAELISAQSEVARKAAFAQLGGGLSERVRGIRADLLRCLAHLEALIDFPEDEVDDLPREQVEALLAEAQTALEDLVCGYREGRLVREGVRVAIVGKPNAGKSSLLNALLGEERALVTDIPGTTRDVVQESVLVEGIMLVLQDTAGVRETADVVERMGVQRSREVASEAGVVVIVVDDSTGLDAADEELFDLVDPSKTVVAINKVDLGLAKIDRDELKMQFPGSPVVELSARQGKGLSELKRVVKARALEVAGLSANGLGERVVVTRARQYRDLKGALESLIRARGAVSDALPPELVGVDLRESCRLLGEVTGETVNEDILDTIFREFCIGK